MKNVLYCLVFSFVMFSCTVDNQNEEEVKVIKHPFEALDQSNFNNVSSVLSTPNKNVRLDSVVYITFYQYNPNTGVSDYQTNYFKSTSAGPPPPLPTHRRSNVFVYNSDNKLTKIYDFFNNKIDDLKQLGDVEYVAVFEYDSNGNLVKRGSEDGPNDVYYVYEYKYDTNSNLILKQSMESNSPHNSVYNMSGDLLKIENWSAGKLSSNEDYTLDAFKNIVNIKRTWEQSTTNYNQTYKYPKNIFNPFANLFPANFAPFIYFSEGNGGYSHFSSGISDKFHQQIQVNEYGFPQVIQSGSYDNGQKTLYYYSVIK